MAYLGKEFILETQENYLEFVNSFAKEVPEDMKQNFIDFKPILKLDKDGDTYTLTTSRPDGSESKSEFNIGEPATDVNFIVATAKSTWSQDGDTFKQTLTFEEDFEIVIQREFSDTEVVVTLTNNKWDGVAKRIYQLK